MDVVISRVFFKHSYECCDFTNFLFCRGFMLGFVLAAVSPAVVVPCLLGLQEAGYGTDIGE